MLRKFEKYFWIFTLLISLGGVYTLLAHPNYGGPYAPDPDRQKYLDLGKKVYQEKKCGACHGGNGAYPLNDDYPIIAGQPIGYLQNQIRQILEGHRTNGMSSQMKASVGKLDDPEILALAKYINSL